MRPGVTWEAYNYDEIETEGTILEVREHKPD